MIELKAPFPFYGGKSQVAAIVWDRFGDVPNYVEPFFGSGAVLLGHPTPPQIETVNDIDCYIANFWRALRADPQQVAYWADWPVNEADLHARHLWLVKQTEFRERMMTDPDYYDVKIAGWWVWGISCWIGSGWCSLEGNSSSWNKLPHLGAGKGVHRGSIRVPDKRPHLMSSKGIHRGNVREEGLESYLCQLAGRLRYVRVCCGDWTRVMGYSVTTVHGLTGVFLDPPYSQSERDEGLYTQDSLGLSSDVRVWALEHGDDPLMRIALCGYEGEHEMPSSWEIVAWKARGGYGGQGENRAKENRHRERIWFSPFTLKTTQMEMRL